MGTKEYWKKSISNIFLKENMNKQSEKDFSPITWGTLMIDKALLC